MTRPLADVERVKTLLAQGMSQSEAARQSGIPQRTVNKWARVGFARVSAARAAQGGCDPCGHIARVPPASYATSWVST